jgi:NAD(P)H-hydrate epimerase
LVNNQAAKVLSLDLPSGVDASSGETPWVFVQADRTLTLALPKPGLAHPAAGRLFLADIGIPPQAYNRLGLSFEPFFKDKFVIEIFTKTQENTSNTPTAV